MAAKKKTAKAKRHISKHVLKAREGASSKDGTSDNQVEQKKTNPSPKAKSTSQKNKHVKDPSEAAAYLTNWNNRKNMPESWKFNKNTQSWLIRHMYEVDKVPKATFKILLEYLDGLQGDTMRSRIRVEASRRARRYKEHVKSSTDKNEDETEAPQDDETKQGDSKKNDNSRKSQQERLEEESRWKALDENDKRKEYKRARIIMDAFKE